jgi:hypothetical protein
MDKSSVEEFKKTNDRFQGDNLACFDYENSVEGFLAVLGGGDTARTCVAREIAVVNMSLVGWKLDG